MTIFCEAKGLYSDSGIGVLSNIEVIHMGCCTRSCGPKKKATKKKATKKKDTKKKAKKKK